MRKVILMSSLLGACALATAHDGHGPVAAHLHATDLFGFTVLGLAVLGLLVWRGRK